MTLGIRYAARSDVGMLREGNEDSAYAGAHLLAVADGMGGHVGGEIASAAAIDELRKLDSDLPATELLSALERTVKTANENLHRIVESDPALQGMGTTLTAMLWAGDQVAVVHIGDSRAYLLRDGSLFQITHDHTLVQTLVDEGRISPDEAASHPQRSLLLRALDGRSEVDPDLSLRDAQDGDRYLLCSDGLSGVVTAETIFQVLSEVTDPDQAVRQLIDLANRGGGPDNITCVVADVVDMGAAPPQPQAGQAVGAAANAAPPEMPGAPAAASPDTPAGRAAALRTPAPGGAPADTLPQPPVTVADMPARAPAGASPDAGGAAEAPRRGPRRWTWLVVAVCVVAVGIVAVGVVAFNNLRGGYYVGAENGQVVLFRGTTQDIPGVSRRAAAKDQPDPAIMLADLPPDRQTAVKEKFGVDGPADVEKLAAEVCLHSLRATEGRIAIVWGKDQGPKCPEKTVADTRLSLAQLPESAAKPIRDGKATFRNRAVVDTKVRELTVQAQQCSEDPESLPDCPSGSRR